MDVDPHQVENALAAVKWLEKHAQGTRRHSDKEKFRSDLNRPESCKMSERLLKPLRKFADFQAEYEGSIPFTRSNGQAHGAVGSQPRPGFVGRGLVPDGLPGTETESPEQTP